MGDLLTKIGNSREVARIIHPRIGAWQRLTPRVILIDTQDAGSSMITIRAAFSAACALTLLLITQVMIGVDHMSNHDKPPQSTPHAVNWTPPSKIELVQRALEDGVADPRKIVVFAEQHDVTMTVDEVLAIIAELKRK